MPFILYESSAGSGKTYTLVMEYISLVISNPQKFRRILAVTFTNKAAAEMKQRILSYLERISIQEEAQLIDDLLNRLGGSLRRDQIIQHSKTVLHLILHNYSEFSIMTIDSFIYRLVSTFSLELGLPIDFEVDIKNKGYLSKITENLIEKAAPETSQGRLLLQFIKKRIEGSDSWNFQREIETVGSELFSERSFPYLDLMFSADTTLHEQRYQTFFLRKEKIFLNVKSMAAEAMDKIRKNGFVVSDFSHGSNGVAGYFKKLSQMTRDDQFEIKGRFLNLSSWASKKHPRFEAIEKFGRNELDPIRLSIIDTFKSNAKTFHSLCTVLKNLPITSLLKDLAIEKTQYRQKTGSVPISDFNQLVGDIIEAESVPFIYWRVGERFEHYLIDEFQDTSVLQLQNLFPLLENAYASGFKNIAVGDIKQSIYRWRSSHKDVMGQLLEQMIPSDFLKRRALTGNYRSSSDIIAFNNSFFSDISTAVDMAPIAPEDLRDLIHQIFNPISVEQQAVGNMETGGYVEIRDFPAKSSKMREDEQLAYTVSTIQDLLKDRFKLKEICILVRSNDEGSRISAYLNALGIAVISPESLYLIQSPAVRFIVSSFAFLLYEERLFLYEMHSYLFGTGPLDLSTHAADHSQQMLDRIVNEYPDFQKRAEMVSSGNLYALAERLIRCFNLHQKDNLYLQGFLNTLSEFILKDGSDLYLFLEWWNKQRDREGPTVSTPENLDAVTVMTIHKSKGLEFPVVIIPSANWKIDPGSSGFNRKRLWVQDRELSDQANTPYLVDIKKNLIDTHFSEEYRTELIENMIDNLNLLYVAFTRPQKRLYVGSNFAEERSVGSIIRKRVEGMTEIDTSGIYRFGTPKSSDQEDGFIGQTLNIQRIASSNWEDKLRVKLPGELADAPLSPGSAARRGILIHRILSEIELEDGIDEKIDDLLSKGELAADEAPYYRNYIHTLMSVKETDGPSKVSDFFSDKFRVFNEREILDENGSVVRPDRVLIGEKETIVIEYKSGSIAADHHRQIVTYRDIVKTIAARPVTAYLLYTDLKKLERISG